MHEIRATPPRAAFPPDTRPPPPSGGRRGLGELPVAWSRREGRCPGAGNGRRRGLGGYGGRGGKRALEIPIRPGALQSEVCLPVDFFRATPARRAWPAVSGLCSALLSQALPQLPQLCRVQLHNALRHRGRRRLLAGHQPRTQLAHERQPRFRRQRGARRRHGFQQGTAQPARLRSLHGHRRGVGLPHLAKKASGVELRSPPLVIALALKVVDPEHAW